MHFEVNTFVATTLEDVILANSIIDADTLTFEDSIVGRWVSRQQEFVEKHINTSVYATPDLPMEIQN